MIHLVITISILKCYSIYVIGNDLLQHSFFALSAQRERYRWTTALDSPFIMSVCLSSPGQIVRSLRQDLLLFLHLLWNHWHTYYWDISIYTQHKVPFIRASIHSVHSSGYGGLHLFHVSWETSLCPHYCWSEKRNACSSVSEYISTNNLF